jgi:serine/threonine-protein kinase
VWGRVEPGTILEGTYRIERRIAEGGMGAVYEASHARLDGRYAVKFLHPDVSSRHPAALARFRREARITSALRHPGIVQVIDFNTPADGPPFLVMEYLEGASLAEVLAREAPFPLARIDDITTQIASALSAVHRKGVVHRDLNPSNVFVMPRDGDQPERVKVLDFGISKVRWASKHITGTAQVLGTPQYMAPEQAEGRVKDLDQAADQFSLAAIVYEMLTGQPAFAGDTLATVAYQVVHAMPAPISRFRGGLPPGVEAVLARGLAKDRGDRFESVSAFAAAFRQAAYPQAAVDSPDQPRGKMAAARWNEADTVVSPPVFLDQLASEHLSGPQPARCSSDERRTVVLRRRRRRSLVGRDPGRLLHLVAVLPTNRRALMGAAVAAAGTAALIATLAVRWHRDPPAVQRVVPASVPPRPVVQPIQPTLPQEPPDNVAIAVANSPIVRAHARPKLAAPEAAGLPFPPDETEPVETGRGLDAAALAPPPAANCSVTVGSSPWAAVWIDGKDTGRHTPVVQLTLPCGTHILELKRRDLRLEHLATVVLRAGDHLKARYQLEPAD